MSWNDVPLTDNKEIVRQRFEDGLYELYIEMKNAPSFHTSTSVGLAYFRLPNKRLAELKLTLTTDEDEFCGQPLNAPERETETSAVGERS